MRNSRAFTHLRCIAGVEVYRNWKILETSVDPYRAVSVFRVLSGPVSCYDFRRGIWPANVSLNEYAGLSWGALGRTWIVSPSASWR